MGKLFTAFIFISCIMLSCSKNDNMVNTAPSTTPTPTAVDTTPAIDTSGVKTYLALGDSYTIGQSVAIADRFPVQTTTNLNEQGIHFSAPEIIAQTGWTTGNLLSALLNTPPVKPSYDIVTLLIGVNNQYQHLSQQAYASEFLTLLNKSIAYAGGKQKRVIVLSIPDYGVTPFANGSDRDAIARDIDAFNFINKNIADSAGTNYLDITADTRLAANNVLLIAADGLHPSGAEYKVWVDGLVPIIKKALQ